MSDCNRRPASVSDVAKAAGVSTQTVSRVVNNVPTVQPEYRQRVLKAMEELGYRPNLAARTLKRGRFNAIGVAMYNLFATGNLRILEGICRSAEETGYSIDLFTFDSEHTSFEAVMRRLGNLAVDGALVVAGWLAIDASKVTLPGDMPVSVITPVDDIPYFTFGDDSEACSRFVVDYLTQKGHRRIGHLAGPSASVSGMRRLKGWRDAMQRHGFETDMVFEGDWTADSGYAAARTFAESSCTAVYASSDQMAYGLIQGLRDLGKHVPDDMSVVGVDDSLEGIVPNLKLTTMRIKSDESGRRAFESTVSAIDHPRGPVVHERLIADLVERETVRDLTADV